MKSVAIKISKRVLALRDDALKLKKKGARLSSSVNIDFSEVYFISRAFADELLNVIESLQADGKKVHLKKMNPGVRKMLQLVKRQRKIIMRELKEAV